MRGFQKMAIRPCASGFQTRIQVVRINRDRTMTMVVAGSEPIGNGMRVSHIDTARIEFKTRPFRVSNEAVLVDMQVHVAIKNYQWANVPLAIIGRVNKADRTTVQIEIGTRPDDPVLLVTD